MTCLIYFNGDCHPYHRPKYQIEELEYGGQVHSKLEAGQVTYGAYAFFDRVRSDLLHDVQNSVRLQAQNGLK